MVGRSGNAKPHFFSDWAEIEALEAVTGTWDDDVCQFPSVRVVEVYYQKINTASDPQYIITDMKLIAPKNSNNNWKFTRPNKNSKQKFTPLVTINFYEDEDR